ncbi:MAG: Cna B-type domain-containing protein [Ruminococcus sp.]|uniref:Cna B-type domain-containing protein n=1 Tax=Ruminococcus sp. TaxID=41978 RepID=UPI0025DC3E2D|nr:Cna B-type domain-containing protein [Ruminococcus sp.]MCR5599461.1 Cna B-type domain-containing protein [Ruminococcus sp.]
MMQRYGKSFMRFFSCVFLTFSLMLMFIPLSGAVGAGNDRSVTLICRKDNTILTGMKWKLYRVGERSGSGFALTGNFAGYPIDINEINEENVSEKAKTLESYAVADGIAPVGSGETDENGELKFSGLSKGIYLAVGRTLQVGNTYYVPSSLLLEADDSDISFSYDAYPKFAYATLGGSVGSYTVRKVWINDSAENTARPSYVTVDLFRNDELYDTVVLNEENNWEHRWIDLEPINDWYVVEREIPVGYNVIIDFNSTQYLIKNSYNPKDTTTTTTTLTSGTTTTTSSATDQTTLTYTTATGTYTNVTSPPTTTVKLPPLTQTGQLWWPIVPLGAGGILLISLGTLIRTKKEDKE